MDVLSLHSCGGTEENHEHLGTEYQVSLPSISHKCVDIFRYTTLLSTLLLFIIFSFIVLFSFRCPFL
jgi:hypothetical protein